MHLATQFKASIYNTTDIVKCLKIGLEFDFSSLRVRPRQVR